MIYLPGYDPTPSTHSLFPYASFQIVALRTGQAIMFAPNGLGVRESVDNTTCLSDGDSGHGSFDEAGAVSPIGQGYLLVQSRLRVTRDGGHSILAVSDPESTTRVGRVPSMREQAPAGCTESAGWSGPSTDKPGGTSATTGVPADAGAPLETRRSRWQESSLERPGADIRRSVSSDHQVCASKTR